MIPLALLAIALSAAAVAYTSSSRARSWVDDHVRAISTAVAAHHTADAHLGAAQTTPDPGLAAQHLRDADAANREAAKATAQAGKTAQTPDQRAAVASSATVVEARGSAIADARADAHIKVAETSPDPAAVAQHAHDAAIANQASAKTEDPSKVAARDARIAAALARLGVGQCDVRTYARVTAKVRDALLAKLQGAGMTVTGDDPERPVQWDVDTHEHGVKLRAVWDPTRQELRLIVTSSDFGVPCFMIWDRIEPIMKGIISAPAVGHWAWSAHP